MIDDIKDKNINFFFFMILCRSLNFKQGIKKDTMTTVSPVVNLDWIIANCSGVDMMFNYYLKMVGQV